MCILYLQILDAVTDAVARMLLLISVCVTSSYSLPPYPSAIGVFQRPNLQEFRGSSVNVNSYCNDRLSNRS